MYQTSHVLDIRADSQPAVDQVVKALTGAGLQVVHSFDLQVARSAHTGCTCPHHGTAQCDCQMVVLLVYDRVHSPATLIAHSHDAQTQVRLVDAPEQRPHPQLEMIILKALVPESFLSLNQEIRTHAA